MKYIEEIDAVAKAGICEVEEVACDLSYDGYMLAFGKHLWFSRDSSNIFPFSVKIVDAPDEWRFRNFETAISAAYTLEFALRCVNGMADGKGEA